MWEVTGQVSEYHGTGVAPKAPIAKGPGRLVEDTPVQPLRSSGNQPVTMNAKRDASNAPAQAIGRAPSGAKGLEELGEERRKITDKIVFIQERLLALLENFSEDDAELKEELKSQR